MLSLFSDVKLLFKRQTISLDNWVFKLHYKITVAILVIFSIIVNSRQYFGDPIDCTISRPDTVKYTDTYCWFNSYTLVHKDGHVLTDVHKYNTPNAQKIPYSTDSREYHRVKQTYYQWIGFILLLQAGCFYLPRFLWKNLCEEGRLKELVNGLQSHIQDDEELLKRQTKIIEYIRNNKGHHLFYAIKFFICEVINFFNVIAQIFLTDWFLGHTFLHYGLQWLWYDENNDSHEVLRPSNRYFPKETFCDLYFGSAGGSSNTLIQERCVLPIHVINEKIYLFLWFYFIIVAIISGMMLIYRVIVLLFPSARYHLFARRAWATDEKIIRTVISEFDIGDWFILYQMMKNMDPFVFGRLMKKVHEKITRETPSIITTEESRDHLLDVFSDNSHSNFDIDDKSEKLTNKGILQRQY